MSYNYKRRSLLLLQIIEIVICHISFTAGLTFPRWDSAGFHAGICVVFQLECFFERFASYLLLLLSFVTQSFVDLLPGEVDFVIRGLVEVDEVDFLLVVGHTNRQPVAAVLTEKVDLFLHLLNKLIVEAKELAVGDDLLGVPLLDEPYH